MKRFLFVLVAVVTASLCQSQSLYVKAYGNKQNEPVIFNHGGPGSSSVYFEATTARRLADRGFFVIVWDRRGEGRSPDKNAKMDFQEAFDDLDSIYIRFGLKKANLIGFSFGGLVTTQYAQRHPSKVRSILLVSALVSQQGSYNTILRSVTAIYKRKKDEKKLQEIAAIEKLDTNSLKYRTEVFQLATDNSFFKVKNPDEPAKRMYATYATDTLIARYVKNQAAVETFWRNEPKKNIDVSGILQKLRAENMPVYAIYGRQDGLYSKEQIGALRRMTGNDRLRWLDRCSHTVFIDQQDQFLNAATTWLKK